MKYYVIAGEASGDLHGANLITEIKNCDSSAEFRMWGGDKMAAAAGIPVVKHYSTYDYMGFLEVFIHLRTITKNIAFCKKDIAAYKPDAIIFVDFPGFNLRIAPFAKKLRIQTFFYISPTVWAWKESRVKHIKAYIDHMFVILPFEKEFYKTRHNYAVDFVGHPLLDSLSQFTEKFTKKDFCKQYSLSNKHIIAVLPGSRKYEIQENLKIMQEISGDFPDYQFVVAGMSRFSKDFYSACITTKNVSLVFDQTYEILCKSDAAIVVSGTATLETALLRVPQVIVYKTSFITYTIGKMLVKLSHVGLPNIIMGRGIVPELLQEDVTTDAVRYHLSQILHNSEVKDEILQSYSDLALLLGKGGASKTTATLICSYLSVE